MRPHSAVILGLCYFVTLQAFASSAVADEPPARLTIATWNLEWFFDDHVEDSYADLAKTQAAPTRADWDWKLSGVAAAIAKMEPTILCLQEIENRRVLYYLMRQLRDEHQLQYKIAYIEGEDFFTEQDVAILYLSGMVEYSRREQTQEDRKSKEFYHLPKHLIGKFVWGSGSHRDSFTLINLHLRAMPEGAAIRQRQAALVRHWLREEVSRGEQVVIIGDLNSNESFEETTPTGDIGTLRGLNTPDTADDLIDLHAFLAVENRPTHIVQKSFDRILVSPTLISDEPNRTDLVFKQVTVPKELVIRGKEIDKDHMNIYWQIPAEERDVSDHWPILAEFEWK